ncbi:MAG: carbohydrate binding domain-containing protein [Prevotella sp.]|nr:carbohydrate binding domain-containing protein [Prevotella sp.]
MKKFIYSMFALAISAMTFTSCEDVPAPYALPGNEDPVVIEPTGSGTLEDPYNVAAALDYVNSLAADAESPQDVYIKGKVVSVNTNYNESEPQFGNAVFYISDDGTSAKQFYVYRALYLGNKKYTSGTTLAKGDEVIICGKVVNYKGTTPETVQSKAFLYSLNGVTEGGGGGDTPTAIEVTCAKAVELTSALDDNATSSEVYAVTGYITEVVGSVSRNQQTFWMADTKDGGKVFEAYYANLPEGVTEFKKGSKVKITGNLLKYVNNNTGAMTPEIKNADVVILEEGDGGGSGGGGDVPSGIEINCAKAVELTTALADNATSSEVYAVTGYITEVVGNVSRNQQTFWMADTKDGEKMFQAYYANLPEGVSAFKKGSKVKIVGNLLKYVNSNTGAMTPEIKNADVVILEEGDGGSGGGGSEGGGGSAVTSLTNGNFETWADGLPTGWKSASTASSATLSQSTDAHGGSYSVLVVGDAANNKRLATQEITLAAGDYTFSIWIKATTEDVAQARLGYVPVTGGKVGNYAYAKDYSNLSTSWQQFSYDFTLSSETTVCLLVMNPKASSYSSGRDILVDDATLTKK